MRMRRKAGTVADLLAGGDPLVELLLAQVDSLMRERGELQRLVAGLQYEHGQMEELIGYLAMNQAEGEEGPGSGMADTLTCSVSHCNIACNSSGITAAITTTMCTCSISADSET
ncbi:hypothetical protein HaLaN_12650 [Haematococcus lacustris]|uniref:Uncharacterized protein n=1 Tax=Haematococcus lacustris TaxID=44745 RepID=A0A699ZBK7_HAELA|nr:hypothetical protein HaLaN_12650 [Haematococcus lacustris]